MMISGRLRMKERLARFAYGLAILLVATYAVLTLAGPKGLAALYRKEGDIQVEKQHVKDLETDIAQRQKRIAELRSNPDAQAGVVEKRLNLVRPGDKVFMLPDPKRK
jgi:cell division protein FtsB